jgi:hypothetical protein
MPLANAAILGTDTDNAKRMTRAKMSEKNDRFIFSGDANLRRVPEYYVYIYNVGPFQHEITRPWAHPKLVIPPCREGELISRPFVIPDIVQEPQQTAGSWTLNIRGLDGKFLAQDAIHPDFPTGNWENYRPIDVGHAVNDGTDLYKFGVWWTLDPEPALDSPEVLAARSLLEATCQNLIQQATELSMSGAEGLKMINSHMHRAADLFKITAPWHQRFTSKVECEGCGELINASVVRHMPKDKCGYVRDWEAALRAGMATKAEAIAAGVMVATEPEPIEEESEPPKPKAQRSKK